MKWRLTLTDANDSHNKRYAQFASEKDAQGAGEMALAAIQMLGKSWQCLTYRVTTIHELNGYEFDAAIIDLMKSMKTLPPEHNRKIHCIKLVKDLAGVGLKEAKDFVDNLFNQ